MTDLNIISKTPENKTIETPLIFVHGMFQGSWVWEEHFLDYFVNKGFECHLINLRGHNCSPHEGQFRFKSIGDFVQDMSSVIDSLQTEPILIGHSMGGFIVQKYLENHQIPLSFLLCPVPPEGMYLPTLNVMAKAPLRFLLANLSLSLNPVVGHKKMMKKMMFTAEMDDQLYDRLYSKMQNESYRAYMDMLLFNLVKTKRIKSRLEIMGTENDGAISAKSVRKTAGKYGVEARIFAGGGHGLMIDKGWQEVADHIIDRIEYHLVTIIDQPNRVVTCTTMNYKE